MGHSTISDPYGDDCLCCWPEGETPSKCYITYKEIKQCAAAVGVFPPPYNGSVEVPQTEGDACVFDTETDPWHFAWLPCFGINNGVEQGWENQEQFKDFHEGNCEVLFENTLICALFRIGFDGSAAVVYNSGPNDGSIGSLLAAINMEPHAETKFEHWPASAERIMIRFARKSDATNILILVEPEEL